MKTITNETIGLSRNNVAHALEVGRDAARGDKHAREALAESRRICAAVRHQYDCASTDAPLLSAPEDQHKLGLGEVPAYGLTLFHYVFKSRYMGRTVNLCPSAGQCTKVCVLNNGHGMYNNVQNGWRWRTDMLLNYAYAFFVKLGYEIERAVIKHVGTCVNCGVKHYLPGGHKTLDHILMRPNVNSDVEWEKVAPALVDGTIFGDTVKFYGYSKHDSVLDTDGWITPHYRVAYSVNENSDHDRVAAFLSSGGAAAVVTDRYYTSKTRQPVDPSVFAEHDTWYDFRVVDADLSDEWMFQSGVIGDLSYKPRTTALRRAGQDMGFVLKVYGHNGKMATLDDVKAERELAVTA